MVPRASEGPAHVSDWQHEFTIAAGSVGITPERRMALAGYRALRKHVFDTVFDELEANVLVLHGTSESTVVMVSVDLLYAGAYICNRIFEACAGRVSRERILIAASHTHYAPATEASLPGLGSVTQDYLDYVATRVVGLIQQLLDAPSASAACHYHEGVALHSVNRRRSRFGISSRYPYIGIHTEIAPNEHGARDDLIRVLTLTEPGGRVCAICWSFACHPNTFPRIDCVSAEYPGRVRQFLRKRFGPIPVLFWQGFSGNINPYRISEIGGHEIERRQKFIAPTLPEWERWADSLSEAVETAISTPGTPIGGPISCQMRSIGVRELGLRSGKQLVYRKIAFGRDLAICGLSAEVAVEYVGRLRAILPAAKVIPIGCTDDVFGYLPVDEMINDGGYEVRGFLRRFGLSGNFRRDIWSVLECRLFEEPERGGMAQQC
jgi:hypothetical protein